MIVFTADMLTQANKLIKRASVQIAALVVWWREDEDATNADDYKKHIEFYDFIILEAEVGDIP